MQQRENKRQRDEATEERERETEQQRVRPPFIKTKARRLREAFVRVAVVDVLWPESGLLNDSSHEQEEALATTAHICQPTSIERCLSFPPGLAQTGLLVKRQRAGRLRVALHSGLFTTLSLWGNAPARKTLSHYVRDMLI